MKCSNCGFTENKVIDSRASQDYLKIRRRRECLKCGKRFTTYETIENAPLLVIKNDGTRQPFEIAKVRGGIIRACEKRPVSISEIDEMTSNVEKQLYNSLDEEVTSQRIGELVMDELKKKDHVAYIRFASVYRQFRDVTTFMNFISEFEKIVKE